MKVYNHLFIKHPKSSQAPFMSNRFSPKTQSFKKFIKNHPISHKVSKIYESRNIMHIIMEIKRQENFESRNLRFSGPNESKFQREENERTFREESDQEYEIDTKNYKLIVSKQARKARKGTEEIIEAKIQEMEDQKGQVPLLLEKFIRKLIAKAQTIKRELKVLKGLNVNEDFVLVNVHVCQFCGQKFAKPCSLGGHISKLHQDEKRKTGRSAKSGNSFQLQAIRKA